LDDRVKLFYTVSAYQLNSFGLGVSRGFDPPLQIIEHLL
jgi:hypothetical protein